ncbi:MAG: transglutaminase domain-containing protein [Ruminococcus sp.]
MKKFLSIFSSAALTLFMVAAGVISGFAVEMPDDYSVEASAYAEQSADISSYEVGASENANYPKITGFSNTADGTKVSWSEYSGASKYRLYVYSGNTWKRVGDSTKLNYTHTSLNNGTTYIYTVRALDKNNNFISDYYRQGYANTFYAPPTVSKLENVCGGVNVKWNKYSGIDSYRIYRKTNNSGWRYIGDAYGATYLDNSAVSGTNYTYTVRCMDLNGKLVSSYSSGKSIAYVKAPTVSKIENTATGSKISWSKCEGAAKYRVYCLDSDNSWKGIATTGSTSFTHDKLKTGTKYTYTVRCLDSKGSTISGYNKTGFDNMFITTPVISSLASIDGGVEVKWGKLYGADGYRIYRKTNNSGWKYIGDSDTTAYTDNSAVSGTSYTYTVRCLDKNGKIVSSYNSGKGITYVKAPSISKIENTATGSKISWSKCEGASKYRVYCLDSNNSWKGIATTSSTSFTHDKLTTGTTYTYTVRCLDSKGSTISGYNKSGKSNLFLEPPTISKVSKADKGNLVKWNSVSGAAGYRLYRRTAGKSWSVLADITSGNSYVDTSAEKDNVYSYTLRCIDKNGNLISYYVSNTKYYYNGIVADGKITVNGESYYFTNGLFRTGYQKINGKKYYFNSNGVIEKNGIVGSEKEGWYYADKNGVCCESEEIRLAADYMMKYCKGNTLDEKMKSGFLYMAKNFPYKRSYDHPKGASDLAPLAADLFKNQKGNCFRYAAGFACVARIAGYRSRVVIGTTAGSPHGWTEVLVNGEWLICDPDAQLPGYKVPDYTPYMMKKHYWQLTPQVKCEVTIENGKAVWK